MVKNLRKSDFSADNTDFNFFDIRYTGHILNLVAKDIVNVFTASSGSKNQDISLELQNFI